LPMRVGLTGPPRTAEIFANCSVGVAFVGHHW
jgi:hypothetical protein